MYYLHYRSTGQLIGSDTASQKASTECSKDSAGHRRHSVTAVLFSQKHSGFSLLMAIYCPHVTCCLWLVGSLGLHLILLTMHSISGLEDAAVTEVLLISGKLSWSTALYLWHHAVDLMSFV